MDGGPRGHGGHVRRKWTASRRAARRCPGGCARTRRTGPQEADRRLPGGAAAAAGVRKDPSCRATGTRSARKRVKDEAWCSSTSNRCRVQARVALALPLVEFKEDLEEITDGADKQLKIEQGIEIKARSGRSRNSLFKDWKSAPVPILQGTGLLMEELEEAQMNMQTFLTMRHVAPFREEARSACVPCSRTRPSSSSCGQGAAHVVLARVGVPGRRHREAASDGGEEFGKVDKDWGKIMQKSAEVKLVIECCAKRAAQDEPADDDRRAREVPEIARGLPRPEALEVPALLLLLQLRAAHHPLAGL